MKVKKTGKGIWSGAMIRGVFVFLMVLAGTPMTVFAGGAGVINSSFGTLRDLVAAMVSSIGAIVLLWGFFELGISMQSQEGSMQSNAFKRIGGALIMVLAPQLISAFI